MWWSCGQCHNKNTAHFSRAVAHYPYVVFVVVSVCTITCLVVVITLADMPEFSDPKLGFEARGTEISNRVRTHTALLDKTSMTPGSAPTSHLTSTQQQSVPAREWGNSEEDEDDDDYDGEWHLTNLTGPQNFFCDVPRKEYARVVFESKDGSSLFTLENIQSMCSLEQKHLSSLPAYSHTCVHISPHDSRCCNSWSLPNYITMLNNHSSCSEVTEQDVLRTLELLKECSSYYRELTLTADCYSDDVSLTGSRCEQVPPRCTYKNAVYHILHYIVDIHFLDYSANASKAHVKYAMTFLPMAAGLAMEEIYEASNGAIFADEHVRVIAVNFGIKHALFDKYLYSDIVWFGVALVAIFLSMWLFTASLFITIMTVISIVISLEVTYFFYTLVFEIPFFPFMNLMTVVILIGIGADDVFIYCKVWTMAKLVKNAGTLEKLVSNTMKHASISMFVTSLTTAAAFYANYTSNIAALSCFALFSGTAVVVNFVLMVTLVPAVLVIHEKWCSDCCICYSPDFYTTKSGCAYYMCNVPYKCYTILVEWARTFFETILPCIVLRLRYLWIVVFGLLGIGGIIVIFCYPKLKLPSTNNFQMFAQDHPFEVYDFKVKDLFWFEKAAGNYLPSMPITVVWGAEAVDTGNMLDPFDEGELVYSPHFNIATPAAQEWLLHFCQTLRSNKFYKREPGIELTNCFIEHFRLFMQRGCEGVNGERLEPCCQDGAQFPYSELIFQQCIQEYLPLLARSSHLYPGSQNSGLRFSKETKQLVALIVEFNSKEPFTLSYAPMDKFYHSLNAFVTEQMATAPDEMRMGWFVSYLEFYDLQNSIATGTPVAIGLSLAVATVVAFLTTLNVLITLHAMLSIAFAIFVTIASLVLLGWELNIVESVTISVAVGLSVDFSLHYGMAYRLAPDLDREMRLVSATSRMASPVTVAAFTTFLAGALVTPSTVLAYRQLGIFLMLVMSISWVYATFFLQSLLRVAGPQGGCGQYSCPSSDCCSSYSSAHHIDKTIYKTESTVSSSIPNPPTSSETHELEPLSDHAHCNQGAWRRQRRQESMDSAESNVSLSRGTVVNMEPDQAKVPVNNNYSAYDDQDASSKLLCQKTTESEQLQNVGL